MKFAINFANFGYLGDVGCLADLACDAEAAGWDGVFLWDHVNWTDMGFHADPWIALGIIAMRTERILIGTGITPIARRRPTKLAREILTLHQLSDGRFVFGAGSGLWPSEFDDLGDSADLKVRAEMLDEGLELLQALWSGEPVDHQGHHYQAKAQSFAAPGTRPRIPIWLGATWPNRKPFRRAARFDGVMAINQDFSEPLSTQDVRDIAELIAANRDSDRPFEILCPLSTSDDAQADLARAQEYEAAGATWWMDSVFPAMEPLESAQTRIRRGPPRG
jgi:alkanesulfonate monooxygenase SsuD/methylene tetrahydromethanopterin reductase-like flavin-dependent oxidoreductase (luciferase family)